jgi:pimeloyl-ACP methyl ester carboxylesterase
MYYEIEGTGDPLVCIPPAFGYAGLNSYPALIQSHTVITIDLQGHGRTLDTPERPLSIEQYAEDVVALLKYLGISKADFFGESYGGRDRNSLPRACRSCGDLRSNLWPSADCLKPTDNAL